MYCGISGSSGYGSQSNSLRRAWTPKEKVLINYRYILEHLEPSIVCDHLLMRTVLDDEEYQSIRTGGTPFDQSDRLLQKLLSKEFSDDIYNGFIATLKACGEKHIVEVLENTPLTPTDISDDAAISALNYLLVVPLADILKDVDIRKLALNCLEKFVITIDEYMEIYGHCSNRTQACEVLTRAIVKMPKLLQTIYGFMKVLPLLKEKGLRFDNRRDRHAVKVALIRGNYQSMPSETHESLCKMSITMINKDAARITHAIQNRHPELLYLFTRFFQASTLQANVGSLRILFKANTAALSKSLMSFILEMNEPLCKFLGDLLFNSGVTQTRAAFFDMTIDCAPLIGTSNIFIHFDPAEVIERRGKMLSYVLRREDFIVIDKLAAYVEDTIDLIDMVLEMEKSEVFLEHIKNTENENVYNRITWFGSFEGLYRGFRVNREHIINIPGVSNLLRSLDRKTLDDIFTDCEIDHKCLSDIYDELCNLGEYAVVDAIRNTANSVSNGERIDITPTLVLKSRRHMVESLIDHKKYLGYGEDFFDTLENIIEFVELKQKLPIFFAHIQDTVQESIYERLAWFGTHQQLMKGFLENYDLLVNFERMASLFEQLDSGRVQKQEWQFMLGVNNRYTMIMFMQHMFDSGFECIAHLYDTLCNIHADDIVDNIRNQGTARVSYDEAAALEANKTVFTGKFKVYTK